MPEKRTIVTRSEILAAIPGSKGLIFNIEKKLGCTRSAVKTIVDCDPDIRRELEDENERERDIVMNNLIEDAKNGDPKARDLFLKSLAVDRGAESDSNRPLVYLHASANNIVPNEKNGMADKNIRIASWTKRANEFNRQQIDSANGKSLDELLRSKTGTGR